MCVNHQNQNINRQLSLVGLYIMANAGIGSASFASPVVRPSFSLLATADGYWLTVIKLENNHFRSCSRLLISIHFLKSESKITKDR